MPFFNATNVMWRGPLTMSGRMYITASPQFIQTQHFRLNTGRYAQIICQQYNSMNSKILFRLFIQDLITLSQNSLYSVTLPLYELSLNFFFVLYFLMTNRYSKNQISPAKNKPTKPKMCHSRRSLLMTHSFDDSKQGRSQPFE